LASYTASPAERPYPPRGAVEPRAGEFLTLGTSVPAAMSHSTDPSGRATSSPSRTRCQRRMLRALAPDRTPGEAPEPAPMTLEGPIYSRATETDGMHASERCLARWTHDGADEWPPEWFVLTRTHRSGVRRTGWSSPWISVERWRDVRSVSAVNYG
jgi:hypothetical protein